MYCQPESLTDIGAGWDACSAICWYQLGVRRQYLVDIKKNLRVPEVNAILRYFRLREITRVEELEDLGIYYKAPASINDVPESELLVSNSVLEHVPARSLKEFVRVPKALHHIDYKDHYASFDKSITPYNFLRFGERTWKLFNPQSHYQNRLRHRDYVSLFDAAHYTYKCRVRQPANAEEMLSQVPIHQWFKDRYTLHELLPTGAMFFLTR